MWWRGRKAGRAGGREGKCMCVCVRERRTVLFLGLKRDDLAILVIVVVVRAAAAERLRDVLVDRCRARGA